MLEPFSAAETGHAPERVDDSGGQPGDEEQPSNDGHPSMCENEKFPHRQRIVVRAPSTATLSSRRSSPTRPWAARSNVEAGCSSDDAMCIDVLRLMYHRRRGTGGRFR